MNGRMIAKQYSWEKVAEETEKVYLDLIRRRNCDTEKMSPHERPGEHYG
jgi:hypothetical protein